MSHHTPIIGVLLLFLSACATVEEAAWSARKKMREPGESLLAVPAEVWEEYGCAGAPLPVFQIETNELLPPRLDPGGEFNHRLVYALCSGAPQIAGSLITRIHFRGQPLVADVAENYALKPGRWQIDTFITLPPDLARGSYALEIEFNSAALNFRERRNFVVQ